MADIHGTKNTAPSRTSGEMRRLLSLPGSYFGLSAEQSLLFLLLLLAGAGYCLPPVNPDEGAIFDFATRMLDGKGLYTDLVDVNPPMIFLLNLLPAFIAKWIPLPIPMIITACVLALPLLGMRALLRFASLPSEKPAVTGIVIFGLVYALILYPGAEFSQREHLLLLTTLPYLVNVYAWLRGEERGRRERLLEIVPFAVAVSLKPYFALLPLTLESLVLLHAICKRRPRIRFEAWVLFGIGAACIAGTLAFFPAYLERMLPLADDYYGIADRDLVLGAFFGSEARQLLLTLGLLFLVYLFFLRRLWLGLLLLCIFTLYLAAALQLKDWFYHFLPAHALAILGMVCCAATLIAERLPELRYRLRRSVAALALVPLLVAGTLPEMSPTGGETPPAIPYPAQRAFMDDGWTHVRDIVERQAQDQTVMWLSQYNEGTARALAYAHATLVAPTMSLWMLPAFYEKHAERNGEVVFHEPVAMSKDERWLWNAVANAFFRNAPPVLVYVKDDPGFKPGQFDYIAYFSMHPRFRARLAQYRIAYEDATARVYVRQAGSMLVAGVGNQR